MRIFIFALFSVLSTHLMAQPAPPASQNPAPIPGLIYLAAGGAALALRNIRQSKDPD